MMQYTQPVVVFDIETIPAQDPTVRAEIERSVLLPKTLKKAESIAAWEAEDRPPFGAITYVTKAIATHRQGRICASFDYSHKRHIPKAERPQQLGLGLD